MKQYRKRETFTQWVMDHDPRRVEVRVQHTTAGERQVEVPVIDTEICPRCSRTGHESAVLMRHGGERQCVRCQLTWLVASRHHHSVFELHTERQPQGTAVWHWRMKDALRACNDAGIPIPEKHFTNNLRLTL